MSKENVTPENFKRKETVESVPYIVYESAQARIERMNKRLIIAFIVAIVMFFVSNLAWLYAWFQYDYVGETVTVETSADGDANYIGNDGDIYNGKNSGTQENP